MKNFIEVFDNLLTTEECKFVVDYMNQKGVSAPGKITVEEGLTVDKERKDSYDISLNFLNNLSCYPTFTSNEKNVKIRIPPNNENPTIESRKLLRIMSKCPWVALDHQVSHA